MVEGQSAIDLLAPTLHVPEFVFQKKSQTLSVKVSRVFEVDIRYKIKKKKSDQVWWHIPIISVSEARRRRITIQSQPGLCREFKVSLNEYTAKSYIPVFFLDGLGM